MGAPVRRLAAALAERVNPPMLALCRGSEPHEQRKLLGHHQSWYEDRMREVQARRPGWENIEASAVRSLARASAGVPFNTERTRAWPLPGGARAWDDLAPSGWPREGRRP